MKILWVNISYYPAPGGAAIDLKLIGDALDKRDDIEKIIVLAEAYPGQPSKEYGLNGKLEIWRIFPFRGGGDKKNIMAYLKYGLQNIKLLQVPSLAKKIGADVVIFHSWYFINPSVLPYIVAKLQKKGIKLVADMRCRATKSHNFSRLYPFDALLCCGLLVFDHFKIDSALTKKLHYVPVPHVQVHISDQQQQDVLEQFKLTSRNFIFSPNGITDLKRFPLTFDGWKVLLDQGEKIDLVVAGRNRDWHERFNISHPNGRLILTGSLDKTGIHALYKSAALSLNTSDFEGLPRVPLEAVYYNRPLLFPPHIPEFNKNFPPEFICNTDDPAELAKQMKHIITQRKMPSSYDMSPHTPKTIAKQISTILKNILK